MQSNHTSSKKSTQSYLVQISAPVKDVDPAAKKETVISAITCEINMDGFK